MCRVDYVKLGKATEAFYELTEYLFDNHVFDDAGQYQTSLMISQARWKLEQAYGASGYPQGEAVEANKRKRQGLDTYV